MTDVDIEEAIVGCCFAFEKGGGNLFTRHDAAGGAHEHFEEIEFSSGKIYEFVIKVRLAGGGIQADVADNDVFRFRSQQGL